MTQDAIVRQVFDDGMAEVVVTRSTACGSNCGNCESCIFQSELCTRAKNLIGAKPGQRVVIESKSSKIYKATLLVYILPIVLVVAGYLIAAAAGAGEGLCIVSSFIGLALGAAFTVVSQKHKKDKDKITFDIIQFI